MFERSKQFILKKDKIKVIDYKEKSKIKLKLLTIKKKKAKQSIVKKI